MEPAEKPWGRPGDSRAGVVVGGLCFRSRARGRAGSRSLRCAVPCCAVPAVPAVLCRASRAVPCQPCPSRLAAGAGGRGGAPGAQVVLPLLQAAPARVHEEVADGGELQAQLLRDGDLHFLGGTLVLLEDGEERSALQVRENQPRFLLGVVPLFGGLLLFAFAGWEGVAETERKCQGDRSGTWGSQRNPVGCIAFTSPVPLNSQD